MGNFSTIFLRIEYGGRRLLEQAREKRRLFKDELIAQVKLLPDNSQHVAEARVKLHYCPWCDVYQVEIWETLEPPNNSYHDFQILDQMGYNRPITRVREFNPALSDIKSLRRLELIFGENNRNLPSGYQISDNDAVWDKNYSRSHQEPITDEPSSSTNQKNTIEDENYLINFQRGWFLNVHDIQPVRYRNAMMDDNNPDKGDNNIIDMRWIIQREFGGSMIFFHEVTVPPGTVEGTHQHIGTEELYYITEGEGIAYMRAGDDPATDNYPTVKREVMGLGEREFKELPVKPGNVIFTKSGGMHGIRNPNNQPLKFVAFLYHTV